MAHHPGWYDRNEDRSYPLADHATRVDDHGATLPPSLLVDCRLRFPRTAGRYAFLGAITVTPRLVALVILGADQLNQASGFTTLATLSLSRDSELLPFTTRRLLALEPQYPGAGGWVALGQGVNDLTYQGRFSLPSQSLLLPGNALAYEPPAIPHVGKLGLATELTGLVRLSGGNDIEIVRECREIPEYPADQASGCDPLIATRREVVVFRLVDKQDAGRNVLDFYRGPCSNRPESRTCGDPEPIEFIGSVTPDCCGNITIDLQGCAILHRVVEAAEVDEDGNVVSTSPSCGVVLDCDQGLSDACLRERYLPTIDGVLPDEVDSLCVSQSLSIPGEDGEEVSQSFSVDPDDEDANADPTLPIITQFLSPEADLLTVSGQGTYESMGFSTDLVDAVAVRNLFLWDAEINGRYKVATVQGELLAGPASPSGVLHNMHVVAGYQQVGSTGRYAYWSAEIDWDGHYLGYPTFQMTRYNGIRWVRVMSVPMTELRLNDVYELSLEVYNHDERPEDAWVRARLKGVTDPSLSVTLGPVLTDDYPLGDVKFGFGTNRAAVRFTRFEIDNTHT